MKTDSWNSGFHGMEWGRDWEFLLNGLILSGVGDEEVLEVGGERCVVTRMSRRQRECTPKSGEILSFMCVFSTI